MIIPLQPGENQTVNVQLGGQQCQINVYEKSTGTYLDLYVSDAPIALSVKCLDRVPIITDAYLGFTGYLMFMDTLGISDPVAAGFGLQYQLQWLS